MYSAAEIRQAILEELQKNGYYCQNTGRSFYLYAKKCNCIFFQELRYSGSTISFNIVIKDSSLYNAKVIDAYRVTLSRELFGYDFKKKVIDDLVRSGYLERHTSSDCSEYKKYSEKELKFIFEKKVKEALIEENVSVLPQIISEGDDRYTTSIEYQGYEIYGIEYRIFYVLRTLVDKKGCNLKVNEYYCTSTLKDLNSNLCSAIVTAKAKGFLLEKSYLEVYKEFVSALNGDPKDKNLKIAFELAYNKGVNDGVSKLSRGVSSMFLPDYKV